MKQPNSAVPERLFLYRLKKEGKDFIDIQGGQFNAELYSRFKYGSGHTARILGQMLADAVFPLFPQSFWRQKEQVISPSAYYSVPTAATILAEYFRQRLNLHLLSHCLPASTTLKIHRQTLFAGDYAGLAPKEREQLIAQNRIQLPATLWKNKHLWVIDDIRVTGLHEGAIYTQLLQTELTSYCFLYIAELLEGKLQPQLEFELNHYAIPNLQALHQLTNLPPYHLNARVCKYILAYPDANDVLLFLANLSYPLLAQLYSACKADGYAEMPAYQANFQLITETYQLRTFSNSLTHTHKFATNIVSL